MHSSASARVAPALAVFAGLLAAGGGLRAADTPSLLDLSLDDLSKVEIKTDITSIRAKPVEQQPGIVTVITGAQARQLGARDLSDVLMQLPGFALDTDVESMVGLTFRGLQGQEGKVLLIVNGIEINEPLYGSLPILNHVPVAAIKQVEVIRGPGGAQYGGSAGLSVIRVTTEDCNQNGGYAVATPAFSRGVVTESYAAGAGFARGDWRWSANVAATFTKLANRDYVALDGSHADQANGAKMQPMFFDFAAGWRDLEVKLIYDRYRYDDLIFYGDTVPRALGTRFDSLLASARYDLRVGESLRITPNFVYRSQLPWYVDGLYDLQTERYAGGITAVDDLTLNSSLMAGVQWQRDSAYARNGTLYDSPAETYFSGSPSVAYVDAAVFAQYDLDTRWANVSVGGRYEHHAAVGGRFVPRAAVTRSWGPWHVKLLASKAARIPAINVLQEAVGGPIQSERTSNLEMELGYRFAERRSLTGNVFYMAVEHPIVFQSVAGNSAAEGYFNGRNISTAGCEGEFRWANDQVENYVGYSVYQAVDNGEPYVRGDRQRFLAAPTHKLAASSTWHLTRQVDWNVNGFWLSSRLTYTYPTAALTDLPPEFVMNTFINYQWARGSLGLGVANLGDVKRYAPQPYNGGEAPVPLLGRTAFLKIGYKF